MSERRRMKSRPKAVADILGDTPVKPKAAPKPVESVTVETKALKAAKADPRNSKNKNNPLQQKIDIQQMVVSAVSLGLPMGQVAEMVGVSTTTMRKWMSRNREFRMKVLAARSKQKAHMLKKLLDLTDSKSEMVRMRAIDRMLGIIDPKLRANAPPEPPEDTTISDDSYL